MLGMPNGLARVKRAGVACLVAVCLLMAVGASAAGDRPPMVVYMDDYALLLSGTGAPLVEVGMYDTIYQINYAQPDAVRLYAAAKDNGLYALMDENGSVLTDFEYLSLEYSDSGILFMKNDKYGAMDTSGHIIVPAEYTMLTQNGAGGFLALRTDPYDDAGDGVYLVDQSGNEKATGVKVTYGLMGVSEGMMPAVSPEDGQYGYLNAEGRWAIQPQYDWCGLFMGGLAEANTSSGAGLINADGNWVITPKYDYVSIGYPEAGAPIIARGVDGQISLIDLEDFTVIREIQGEDAYGYALDNGLVVMSVGHQETLYNYDGEELFTVDADRYIDAWQSSGDVVIVSNGEWGTQNTWLYDLSGVPVAGPYQALTRAGSLNGREYFVFDTFKTYLSESPQYEDGASFYDEVPGSRRCGLIDQQGKVIVDAVYDSLYAVDAGIMKAETPGYYAIIDLQGNELRRFERYNELID